MEDETMIPKHFRLGRLHILWWPLKTLRGRLAVHWDSSDDGRHVMRTFIDHAIASRFCDLRDGFTKRSGEYTYGTDRTRPYNLGWRFRASLSAKWHSPTAGIKWAGYPGILRAIRNGHHDQDIENTWHAAAAAEYQHSHGNYCDLDDEAAHQALIEAEIYF